MFNLNVKANFFMIREARELLKNANKGDTKEANILLVSSIEGSRPSPAIGVYGMTKAALNNMAMWMCRELSDDDIRINTISPGLIETDFSQPIWKGNDLVAKKHLGHPK